MAIYIFMDNEYQFWNEEDTLLEIGGTADSFLLYQLLVQCYLWQ
jgi:hypothetical protein